MTDDNLDIIDLLTSPSEGHFFDGLATLAGRRVRTQAGAAFFVVKVAERLKSDGTLSLSTWNRIGAKKAA